MVEGSPSTCMGKKSGHSLEPAMCISCSWFHSLRSGDARSPNRSPSKYRAITQRLEESCQMTFGSRFSRAILRTTGFREYFVQVRPRSLLQAMDCVNGSPFESANIPPAAVYMATKGGNDPV